MRSEKPTTRLYRGSSAEERRAQRRAQLIEAAIQIYGEQGYRNTSVRAVCVQAGLTERYFYEAFPNSQALLIACFETVTRHLVSGVTTAGDAAPADRITRSRRMLQAYFERLREAPSSARVFLIEITGVSPAVDAVFSASLDRFTELTLDTLDPERRGPVVATPILGRAITGGILHIALAWIGSGYAEPIETLTDSALRLGMLAAPTDAGAQP